jgi:hypothetical protein
MSIAVVFGLISMPDVAAQAKTQKGADLANIQGIVQNMSKDTSTLTVRTGTGSVTRQVIYDGKTKFLYGHSNDNKPGAVAQLKDSYFVSCVGTFNDKNQLMASECVYRETK